MTRAAAIATPLDTSCYLVIEDRCAGTIFECRMRELEPYLQRAATHIADDFPGLAEDLAQEARIALWELDLGRFTQRDRRYLKRILTTRMLRIFYEERLAGLTTGWSKHGVPNAPRTKKPDSGGSPSD